MKKLAVVLMMLLVVSAFSMVGMNELKAEDEIDFEIEVIATDPNSITFSFTEVEGEVVYTIYNKTPNGNYYYAKCTQEEVDNNVITLYARTEDNEVQIKKEWTNQIYMTAVIIERGDDGYISSRNKLTSDLLMIVPVHVTSYDTIAHVELPGYSCDIDKTLQYVGFAEMGAEVTISSSRLDSELSYKVGNPGDFELYEQYKKSYTVQVPTLEYKSARIFVLKLDVDETVETLTINKLTRELVDGSVVDTDAENVYVKVTKYDGGAEFIGNVEGNDDLFQVITDDGIEFMFEAIVDNPAYRFVGWEEEVQIETGGTELVFMSDKGSSFEFTSGDSSETILLRPVVEKIIVTHTVTFDLGDGWYGLDESDHIREIEVEHGSSVTPPSDINNYNLKEFNKWIIRGDGDLENIESDTYVDAEWYQIQPIVYETKDTIGLPNRYLFGNTDIDNVSGDTDQSIELLNGRLVTSLMEKPSLENTTPWLTEVYTQKHRLMFEDRIEIPFNLVKFHTAVLYMIMYNTVDENGGNAFYLISVSDMVNEPMKTMFTYEKDTVNKLFVLRYNDGYAHLNGVETTFAVLYTEDSISENPDEGIDEDSEDNNDDTQTTTTSHPTTYYDLTLSSTEGGVAQPFEGTNNYPQGIFVGVEAVAEVGYVFTGFSGDTDKLDGERVTLDSNVSLVAEFELIEEQIEDEEVAEDDGSQDVAEPEEEQTSDETLVEEEPEEVIVEDEQALLDEATPEDTLPETGGMSLALFHLIGTLVTWLGVTLKKW